MEANKSWLDWVNENLQRKCDPLEIGNILLKNKFTLPQIRKIMKDMYPEELGQPASNNTKQATVQQSTESAESKNHLIAHENS